MPTLKTISFAGCVILRVIHIIPVHVVIQQEYVEYTGSYEYQLVLFLTFLYYRKPPKILLKYIPYFIVSYQVHSKYTTTCDTGGRTSLHSIRPVPSTYWCHI